jgi:hypothetical protein
MFPQEYHPAYPLHVPGEKREQRREMLVRLLMIAILLAGGASARSQSLAEVAAKEKERRAKTGGSAKSFTDADLRDAASKRAREGTPSPRSTPSPSPAPTRSDSSRRPTAAADSGDSTDPSASLASKKARGAEYRARLDAANEVLKHAEEELRTAENDWNMAEHHPWQMASVFDQARARFEAAKKRVEQVRRERDDIEDAARREGIPPGYMR